jgi:hypothetical protein
MKTSRFRETHEFFKTTLGMKIEEFSVRHFVIHSEGIRILFVESTDGPKVELYLAQKSAALPTVQEDPNHVKIIIT